MAIIVMHRVSAILQSAFVVVLIVLTVKIGNTSARSLTSKTSAYSEAPSNKQLQSNSLTSYYRHDPYGLHTYAFGYEVNDNRTGNVQFRDERRYLNNTVEGSYGYVRPDGRVTVTHYRADAQNGYLSQTQTFEAGQRPKWQSYWPTKQPNIFVEHPEGFVMNATYDKERHLNMTDGKIPEAIANALQQQHGLDVTKVDLQEDLINQTLSDIINGKIPLQRQKDSEGGGLGFETVDNFIPPDFPIVPFQLPEKLEEQIEKQPRPQPQEVHESTNKEVSKNDKAQQNNVEEVAEENDLQLPPPLPLSGADGVGTDKDPKWYEAIIADTRREFLQNLPGLDREF